MAKQIKKIVKKAATVAKKVVKKAAPKVKKAPKAAPVTEEKRKFFHNLHDKRADVVEDLPAKPIKNVSRNLKAKK